MLYIYNHDLKLSVVLEDQLSNRSRQVKQSREVIKLTLPEFELNVFDLIKVYAQCVVEAGC